MASSSSSCSPVEEGCGKRHGTAGFDDDLQARECNSHGAQCLVVADHDAGAGKPPQDREGDVAGLRRG